MHQINNIMQPGVIAGATYGILGAIFFKKPALLRTYVKNQIYEQISSQLPQYNRLGDDQSLIGIISQIVPVREVNKKKELFVVIV